MSPANQALNFTKGHGTGNDFVIIPDPDGTIELAASQVQAICDRRFGIGADGILRVVPAKFVVDSKSDPAAELWFMDYRNADGSVAEMCGNGSRVFAQYLIEHELISPAQTSGGFLIETRAGIHEVRVDQGSLAINMGHPRHGPGDGAAPQPLTAVVSVGEQQWPATAWWLPNPHTVVVVDDLDVAGSLLAPPQVTAPGLFPDGQNVEFLVDQSNSDTELSASIRIFERGVGETLSCGTGACAAALALRELHGVVGPGAVEITVPGGLLQVEIANDGSIWLAGPAKLVAEGTLNL